MSLRILIADDSVLFRRILGDAISHLPDIEVVASVNNGKSALTKIQETLPDLALLDIEMPEMSGLEVLEAVKNQKLETDIIIISGLSLKGSDMTVKALEKGAFDFVKKPTGGSPEQNNKEIAEKLVPLIKAYAQRLEIRSILKGRIPTSAISKKFNKTTTESKKSTPSLPIPKPEMVIIGVSTGGPNALATLLPALPENLNVPVVIVQHMPPLFTQSLATSLDNKCKLRVKEALDGEIIEANKIYIAPGGKQTKVMDGTKGNKIIRITDDPPENNCKPSVDYLFRSIAHNFKGRATAVILTGMGNDGTMGLKLLKRHGTYTIAQDEQSCVVFGMPREAINAGVIDTIAPLDKIADEIVKSLRSRM